jgi:outer membrane protein TolC
MITKKRLFYFSICFTIAQLFILSQFCFAQESSEFLTIEKTIENAIKVNLGLKSFEEDTKAAMSVKKSRFTNFLPTLSTRYQFERMDEGSSIGGFATTSRDEYSWVTSFNQPIFTGFSLLRQYDKCKNHILLAVKDPEATKYR